MTREPAKKLSDEGYDFIDLCGDFDAEKTEKIRKAIDYKVPVGYCGNWI